MLSRILCFILLCAAGAVAAEPTSQDNRLTFLFGPYVYHFDYDPAHNNQPDMIGLEWSPPRSFLDYGAVYFRNSFDQSSVYAYAEKRWFLGDDQQGVYFFDAQVVFLGCGPAVLFGYDFSS